MEPFHLFYFDNAFKNIGIKLSGGSESSIVYYGICDYYKDNPNVNIYALTMYTDDKPWILDAAKNVIETVKALTGRDVDNHYAFHSEGRTAEEHARLFEAGQENMTNTAIEQYNLDVVYSGISKNPPIKELLDFIKLNQVRFGINYEELINHLGPRDLTRNLDTPLLEEVFLQKKYSHPVTRVRPFINYDKKETYNAYKHYNVLDTLYPISYSCTMNTYSTNNDRSKVTGHCGRCFSCLERLYGFDEIV